MSSKPDPSIPAPDSNPPASSQPAELPTAGPISRLAALGYDSFLIFGLLVVPLFILTGLRERSSGLQTDGVIHDLPPIASRPVLLLYMICMVAGFYYYFWRRNGQTLGMQAWRLRLDSRDGGRASLRQCLIRMPVGLLSLLCGGLGYWWIWLDREQLAWHDRASGTRVVVLPKRPKVPKQKAGAAKPAEVAVSATKKAGKASATAPKTRRRR
jgi:uncharacterized RDD family membrane protein YckC